MSCSVTTTNGPQPVIHLRPASLVIFVVVALLAGACSTAGTGNGATSGTDVDPASPVQTADGAESATAGADGVQADDAAGGVDASAELVEPGSIEELEAQWARARTEVVDSIRAAGYGVDADNVLRGPAGFEVDLNQCPTGWDDQAGVGDTIRIAKTSPQTGELWAYGLIADGLEIYFDHTNRAGGVGGKQLELQILDDGYDRSQTETVVEELLATDPPFAVTTFGGPTSFAVTERLNDECVPQPFVMSNHPAWGDPVNHPWTTGMQLAYNSEALLWASWIKQNLGGKLPVTVSALVVDSEFGRTYENAFADWVDKNPDVVAEFVPVRHPERAASVSAEMSQIASADPDVFIAMTNESPCLLAVLAAGEAGLTDSDTDTTLFTSSVCRSPDLYMTPAGSAADGFLSLGGGWKVPNDPALADDIYMQWVNNTLAEAQVDIAIGFFGSGFAYYGWAYVEALRIAAELDGGLSRSNLIIAQRALQLDHPALQPGIRFAMDGSNDGYFVEGSVVDVFDAQTGVWNSTGTVLDLNQLTPNCHWDGTRC